MGCHISKLDEEEETPVKLRSFKRRTSEIKLRRQVVNVNSILTTVLLRPEDKECVSEGGKGDFGKKTDEEMPMAIVTTKEEQRKKNNVVRRDENEELPGSPSFRVYFSDTTSFNESDDPVKVIKKIKEERLVKENERIQADDDKERVKTDESEQNTDSLISREDSSNKQPKKEWGRRFKALTKVPSRVYNFFSVKNCYYPSTSSDETSDGSPRHHAIKPS